MSAHKRAFISIDYIPIIHNQCYLITRANFMQTADIGVDLKKIFSYLFDYMITPGTSTEEAYLGVSIAIVFGLIAFVITRFYTRRLAQNEESIKSLWVQQVIKSGVCSWFNYLIPVLAIQFFFSFYELSNQDVELNILNRLFESYILLAVFIILLKIIAVLKKVYAHSNSYKRTLTAYFQIAQLAIIVVGSIVGICLIMQESPWKILSGLGAITAVILFVFRDTILSTIANIQIEYHDLIRVGDAIEVSDYDADGTIVEIKFHSVKVQNWDQSFVYIPIYKFLENSYKNWRGINEGSARRIRNTFLLDPDSIHFCTEELLTILKEVDFMQTFFRENKLDQANKSLVGRTWTNLGIFRSYLGAYLVNNLKLRQDMPWVVRQLAPTKEGIVPVEIYVFTSEIEWINYENIQAEILDHILAAMRIFGLRTVVLKQKK